MISYAPVRATAFTKNKAVKNKAVKNNYYFQENFLVIQKYCKEEFTQNRIAD